MKFAIIQGSWHQANSGTGVFFPLAAILFATEEDAWSEVAKYRKSHDVDWYVVPIYSKVKENSID
jgi:hypothetical protein